MFNGHKDNAALMDILEFELDVIHIRIADLKDIAFELQGNITMYVCMKLYVCMYVCLYAYLYAYLYKIEVHAHDFA